MLYRMEWILILSHAHTGYFPYAQHLWHETYVATHSSTTIWIHGISSNGFYWNECTRLAGVHRPMCPLYRNMHPFWNYCVNDLFNGLNKCESMRREWRAYEVPSACNMFDIRYQHAAWFQPNACLKCPDTEHSYIAFVLMLSVSFTRIRYAYPLYYITRQIHRVL